MKKIDIARLVIFFLAGIGLYFYMSNAVAAQPREPKSIIQMKPEMSYALWDAVNALEDSWFVKDSPELKVAPLGQLKEKTLLRLVQNYPELAPLAKGLIITRKRGDWDNFLLYKERMAEKLSGVWRHGAQATMREEAKKRSLYNRLKNWLTAWRQSAYNAVQHAYAYFFSGTPQQSSPDNHQTPFLQEILGQKIPHSVIPQAPALPLPAVDKK